MTKTIELTTSLPNDWCEAQREKYIDHRDYNQLISGESVDVLKPDGSLLLKFRPGVLPSRLCEEAQPGLRKAANTHGERREWWGGIFGFYDKPTCRKTSLTANNIDEYLQCLAFARGCNRVFREELPQRYAVQRRLAYATGDWVMEGTAFTTGTVNLWNEFQDGRTFVHTDRNDLPEGFGVLSVISTGDYTGGELIFLKYGVAVDMRTTDVLLADVHELHGNAPIPKECESGWERLATILYYRTKMRNCPATT